MAMAAQQLPYSGRQHLSVMKVVYCPPMAGSSSKMRCHLLPQAELYHTGYEALVGSDFDYPLLPAKSLGDTAVPGKSIKEKGAKARARL